MKNDILTMEDDRSDEYAKLKENSNFDENHWIQEAVVL
jgi:hypothetical protein